MSLKKFLIMLVVLFSLFIMCSRTYMKWTDDNLERTFHKPINNVASGLVAIYGGIPVFVYNMIVSE